MVKNHSGFSLIELLVVVGIIALLGAIGVVSYGSARKNARDAKRKADLEQIRAALEMYKADNNEYPCGTAYSSCLGTSGAFGSGGHSQGWASSYDNGGACGYKNLDKVLQEKGYLTNLVRDPLKDCSGYIAPYYWSYMYYVKGGYGKGYCLYARLENPPVNNGCTGCPTGPMTSYSKNYCVQSP